MTGQTPEQQVGLTSNVDIPTVERAGSFLNENKLPVDYGVLTNPSVRVLFLGESSHLASAARNEVSTNMQVLKELGVTHIALEMLGSDTQELVDGFLREGARRGLARIKLYAALKLGRWDYTTTSAQEYMQVADSAKQAGLGILAIDKVLGEDVDATADAAVAERNIHWRDIVVGFLNANQDAKVAVFCGSAHCTNNKSLPSVNNLLRSDGIKTSSAVFIGGINIKDLDELGEIMKRTQKAGEAGFEEVFERAAHLVGASKERFMVDMRSLGEGRPIDFFIHLPQIESSSILR